MKLIDNQKGFSLLEIMISLVLLALIILPMAVMYGNGAAFLKNNEMENTALLLAQREIEEIKTREYEDIEDEKKDVTQDGITFTVDTNVSTNGNLKNITVTVTWVGVNNTNRQLQLETVVARRW